MQVRQTFHFVSLFLYRDMLTCFGRELKYVQIVLILHLMKLTWCTH